MKKPLLILIIAALLLFFILRSCAGTDPMEIPMKAGTIEEYNESILDISRKIKGSHDKESFISALEEIAYGPYTALNYKMGKGLVGMDKDLMRGLISKCDGKTPEELIEMAREEKSLKLSISMYFDDREKMDEIEGKYDIHKKNGNIFLLPKKHHSVHQEPDPRIRRSDSLKAYIDQRLGFLMTDIQNWRNFNNYGPEIIPTTDDMINHFGSDKMYAPYPDMEFIILEAGRPACIYRGKTYTRASRELGDPDFIFD